MPQLDASAFWGIAGIVVGAIIATFFFIIGKKKTLLQYDIITTPLVTDKMAGILNNRMSIDGQPIESLISTKIKFANVGNQSIDSSDFAAQEPLRITLTDHLYGFDISTGNQDLLPVLNRIDDKTVNVIFEGLQPKKYFTATILHDGHLEVRGVLRTGEMRPDNHEYALFDFLKKSLIFSFAFSVLFILGFFILMILYSSDIFNGLFKSDTVILVVLIVWCVLSSVLAFLFLTSMGLGIKIIKKSDIKK